MRAYALSVNASTGHAVVEYGTDRCAVVDASSAEDFGQEDVCHGDFDQEGRIDVYNESRQCHVSVTVRASGLSQIEARAAVEAGP